MNNLNVQRYTNMCVSNGGRSILSAKGLLDINNIIHRPYRIINLKVSPLEIS